MSLRLSGKPSWLKTRHRDILSESGQPVRLRGVNLGGWLMMEGYLLQGRNIPFHRFRERFIEEAGKRSYEQFQLDFYRTYVTGEDWATIRRWGANCVRLPFHYGLLESRPFVYREKGFEILDQALAHAARNGLWVILDLHAACGAQSRDWHADSDGKARLWSDKVNRERTWALWERIADRYKDHPEVAGYDLLNEPATDAKKLNLFYRGLIQRIRSVDRNHILFLEGNRWSTELEFLEDFSDDNYAFSCHSYEPVDFTFSLIPNLTYPSQGGSTKGRLRKHLSRYAKLSRARKRPMLVGEFGLNFRRGAYGEIQWLDDMLSIFDDLDFHWTYWTYKSVKNHVFPDGLLSYYPNPSWVNRVGPETGWETFARLWRKNRDAMVASWDSRNFQANQEMIACLRNHL